MIAYICYYQLLAFIDCFALHSYIALGKLEGYTKI